MECRRGPFFVAQLADRPEPIYFVRLNSPGWEKGQGAHLYQPTGVLPGEDPEKEWGPKKDEQGYKVGPLLVINGVITPTSRVITPVTHL